MKRKILISIIVLLALGGLFFGFVKLDDYKFYSKHKDYNEKYLFKITYLISDKNKIPNNTKIDDIFEKYDNSVLYSIDSVIPLQKKRGLFICKIR